MSTPVARLANYANDSASQLPISSAKVDSEMDAWVAALNRKVVVKSTAPSSPTTGDTWVDSTNLKVKTYDGSSWLEAGGIGYSANITYSEDDIVSSAGVVYVSLQNSNKNHTPASSPTYWTAIAPTPTTVTALGNISGTQAVEADKAYTATLTGNVTLTMPTPTDDELHNVLFEFTMSSAYTVTVSGLTWNYGSSPSLVADGSTINRMVFDTIDAGATWKGYYSQF